MRSFESVTKSIALAARWKQRAGAWALVALLFSSVFTIFNLLAAVLMPLSDFGLFSYGQSLVLLVGIFISTLVLEPTTTVGTKYEDHEQLCYLSFALIASLVVFAILSRDVFGFWIQRIGLSDAPWPRRVGGPGRPLVRSKPSWVL